MTEQRKGFASPLKKAQAGQIGGGKSSSGVEQGSAYPETPEVEQRAGPKTSTKKRNRERLTIYLPPRMVEKIRLQAASERKEISEVVEALLQTTPIGRNLS